MRLYLARIEMLSFLVLYIEASSTFDNYTCKTECLTWCTCRHTLFPTPIYAKQHHGTTSDIVEWPLHLSLIYIQGKVLFPQFIYQGIFKSRVVEETWEFDFFRKQGLLFIHKILVLPSMFSEEFIMYMYDKFCFLVNRWFRSRKWQMC